MNCECIYYNKNASKEDYNELAKVLKEQEKFVELYPVSISRMDEPCRVCEDYNGWGKATTIPKYSRVLFAGGKLHNMTPIRIGRKTFKPWHPIDYPVFTDLVDDFEQSKEVTA